MPGNTLKNCSLKNCKQLTDLWPEGGRPTCDRRSLSFGFGNRFSTDDIFRNLELVYRPDKREGCDQGRVREQVRT